MNLKIVTLLAILCIIVSAGYVCAAETVETNVTTNGTSGDMYDRASLTTQTEQTQQEMLQVTCTTHKILTTLTEQMLPEI